MKNTDLHLHGFAEKGLLPKAGDRPAFVGVDPSAREGGFWACLIIDNPQTGRAVFFLPYRDVLVWDRDIRALADFAFLERWDIHIGVENSNEQKFNFDAMSWGNKGVQNRLSRNVGANMAVSALAVRSVEDCRERGLTPYSISPGEKGRKLTEREFEGFIRSLARLANVYGYEGPKAVAQDKRDAFKLAVVASERYLRCAPLVIGGTKKKR